MKIGIMGAQGSFSEQAAMKYCTEFTVEQAMLEPLVTGDAVLRAVTNGVVEKGIMPIENSNGGIVIEAVHAMAAYQFQVERMFEFDVHHMLLVRPGVTASQITTIASHDQALKQCRMYLRRTWTDADIEPYADTAKAAADLGAGVLPESTAVIAPRSCAALYGLEIMEESIQDLKFNYTTFMVVVPFRE